jgi:hypothetical protein
MSRIDNLDKVLNYVSHFSENLASVNTADLSMNVGIDIDELTEYLEELGKRGYINNYDNGSYITLQGRLALENAKKGKPFKEEVENNKLKKYWSITKITAGVLNALAIIIIAVWTQVSSDKNTKLEKDIESLKSKHTIENIEKNQQIESLNNVIKELKQENIKLTTEKNTKTEKKVKK